jgi:hypothetical protein
MKLNIKEMEKAREDSIPFEPCWAAHNPAAHTIVDHAIDVLGYSQARPTSIVRYRIVIASIFALSANIDKKVNGALALSKDGNTWAPYAVGRDIILRVFSDMQDKGWISFRAGSGKFILYEDDDGKTKRMGLLSQYVIHDSLYALESYYDAAWIEAHKPPVLVSVSETYGAKVIRKQRGMKKPKMRHSKVLDTFGKRYGRAATGVNLLGKYWQSHPLCLPPKDNNIPAYAASATRVYHDGRMDSGGRYYGAWVGIEGKQRLLCSIDDEPVAQIDLNASQPTLFSSLLGHTMEVGNTWDDLYAEMLRGFTNTGSKDSAAVMRKKIKQCAVEIIGTGNITKKHPAPDSNVTWASVDEWDLYRLTLLHHVPALTELNDEYYNGSGFISFHEAEIMQQTLVALMALDIPAYPVHDCVLVKQADQDQAVETYRSVIRDYVLAYNRKENKTAVNILVPVSIEKVDTEKVRLSGSYA